MKITIELTDSQVNGLKSYLAEVNGKINSKIEKAEIRQEIQGIIECNLQTGAIADYIKQYENAS